MIVKYIHFSEPATEKIYDTEKALKNNPFIEMSQKEFDERELNRFETDEYILRHEIIHAFMYESGLWCNSYGVSSWAENEEMTDWFAIQSPKIFKVYKQLKILD